MIALLIGGEVFSLLPERNFIPPMRCSPISGA